MDVRWDEERRGRVCEVRTSHGLDGSESDNVEGRRVVVEARNGLDDPL